MNKFTDEEATRKRVKAGLRAEIEQGVVMARQSGLIGPDVDMEVMVTTLTRLARELVEPALVVAQAASRDPYSDSIEWPDAEGLRDISARARHAVLDLCGPDEAGEVLGLVWRAAGDLEASCARLAFLCGRLGPTNSLGVLLSGGASVYEAGSTLLSTLSRLATAGSIGGRSGLLDE